MGSALGIPNEKIEALANYRDSSFYTDEERLALEYADHMTITGEEVTDQLFAKLKTVYSDDQIVELTVIIAWENSSSKFNRALRVPSQRLWRKEGDTSSP